MLEYQEAHRRLLAKQEAINLIHDAEAEYVRSCTIYTDLILVEGDGSPNRHDVLAIARNARTCWLQAIDDYFAKYNSTK